MPRYQKTPVQKLQTKINRLLSDNAISDKNGKIKIRNKIIFKYNEQCIEYTKKRYYPTKKKDLADDDFIVTIILSHENLNILSSNIINPPSDTKYVLRIFERILELKFEKITIGVENNCIEGTELNITKSIYDTIRRINKEEGKDKATRVNNRTAPLISENFNVDVKEDQFNRDYSLMLDEILASGEFTQEELLPLIEKLEEGPTNEIVIKKQISKQVEWLIGSIQRIIDEPDMNKLKAKSFGKEIFNFNKSAIKGEEHLMELILTKYGKNTLFGVPELINTDKYVINERGLPRCQFDIILVNYLNDIEVVELKKPSQIVLDYDTGRNKFYPSKDLSIAIAQAERYISTFHKDHDNEYVIQGKTIREYINDQFGGLIEINVCRPSALIIIGSKQTLTKDYDELPEEKKRAVSRDDFHINGSQAYTELKNSFKNINILTYSELLENARLRIGFYG